MTPTQMDQTKAGSTSGRPLRYTILGDNFRFAPTPDATYTATINYYKAFTPLSGSESTNLDNLINSISPSLITKAGILSIAFKIAFWSLVNCDIVRFY